MAAEALAQLDARAQPVGRPIFGEGARLERPADVAEAAQIAVVAFVAREAAP